MKKEWFVLHALTGQENKVQQSIAARVKINEMGDYVGQCLVPTEKVQETKNGKKRTVTKKVFPGYVLVELALYDDSRPADSHGRKQIVEETWQFLRETPGVIGFIGGERPVPLRQDEVDAIVNPSAVEREVVRPKINFNVDDTVKINDGPFLGLMGQVSMVDPDKGKLKVEVSIFNRKVQVDVEYWQVSKATDEEIAEAK